MSDAGQSVGIVMGSQSDWDTMRHAASTLERLGIAYETRMSQHIAHPTGSMITPATQSRVVCG